MAIQTVSGVEINNGLLQVLSKDGNLIRLHYKQGEMDGACAVYSVAFCMMYEQMVDGIHASGRTNGERLLRELLDKYGMVRQGFNFKNLKSIIDKYKKKSWLVEHYSGTPKQCLDGIVNEIDDDRTPIIRIGYRGSEMGHALLAVAYEYDEQSDKVNKIFCLDPSAPSPRTAIWNSYIDVRDLRKPSIHVNDDPDCEPAECRITNYLILHDTDFDEYLLDGYY